MYSSHQSRTRVSSGSPSRALFSAGYGGHERGTREPHLLRNGSLYVKASKHPLAAVALVGAAGVLAAAALRGGGQHRDGTSRRA